MRSGEHFLFALLPLLVYTAVRYRRLPTGRTVLLVLVATQLPDLIDKPLAWVFGVLPSGRMLAHSIVVSGPLLGVGCLLAIWAGGGRRMLLFTLAYLSHLLGDFYPILWAGRDYYYFPNLFWPVMPANPDYTLSVNANLPSDLSSVVLTLGLFFLISCYVVADIVWRSEDHREHSPPL